MKINIFGLGYVGCVTAACLAEQGHEVTGIDIDQRKVDIINKGKSPIVEEGLEDCIFRGVSGGLLKALKGSIPEADVSFVCVGTPSNENGSLRLDYLERVSNEIGRFLKIIDFYHVVNIRSTVLPGTVEGLVIPILEKQSGKKAGCDFGVCMNPEFMREGSSIKDYYNPPFTVVGSLDARSGELVKGLYEGVDGAFFLTDINVAEMVKYSCNVFHALKVTFGNEIGNLSKAMGVDSHKVMEIFCSDGKLNLSPYYLKPGYAFGGSCLPKDTRAILYKAKEKDLETPLLSAILPSNAQQVEKAFQMIMKSGKRKIGIVGLSFKKGTDDLRESPMVDLVEKLIGKGLQIAIFDREVSLARIFGSNKDYIEKAIPHISSLLTESIDNVIEEAELVVIGKMGEELAFASTGLRGKMVVDLIRVPGEVITEGVLYDGICW